MTDKQKKNEDVNKLLYVRSIVGDVILTKRLVKLANRGELSDEDIERELKRVGKGDYIRAIRNKESIIRKFKMSYKPVFIGEFAKKEDKENKWRKLGRYGSNAAVVGGVLAGAGAGGGYLETRNIIKETDGRLKPLVNQRNADRNLLGLQDNYTDVDVKKARINVLKQRRMNVGGGIQDADVDLNVAADRLRDTKINDSIKKLTNSRQKMSNLQPMLRKVGIGAAGIGAAGLYGRYLFRNKQQEQKPKWKF